MVRAQDRAKQMEKRFIPVAAPVLSGREKEYVLDCLESNWISSAGKYIEKFESAFAEYCGVRHAVACCNGTVALHLALLALGVKPGDEVIVPALTFIATANAVVYCGARPVFADVDRETWNIDPHDVEQKITERTRGVVAVHLYGHTADMDAIRDITVRRNLFVLEDAAEAHGAKYRGKTSGSLGTAGTFSFYGNKIMTCGEGGMVTTDDGDLVKRVRLLRGQGMDPERRYWFPVIGYNYRLTNVGAAIGLAQLENVESLIGSRLQVVSWYREFLSGVPGLSFQAVRPWARHVYWMFNVLMHDEPESGRDEVAACLLEAGIETRPVFPPLHLMPPYVEMLGPLQLPVAEHIGSHGISLPTWAGLTRDDVRYVCDSLKAAVAARVEKKVGRH